MRPAEQRSQKLKRFFGAKGTICTSIHELHDTSLCLLYTSDTNRWIHFTSRVPRASGQHRVSQLLWPISKAIEVCDAVTI